MTISDLKQAIRVDYDDDDAYIALLMEAATDYISDAVGEYDESNPRHELMLIALVDDAYRKRSYTVEKTDHTRYIVRSIVAQLNDGW